MNIYPIRIDKQSSHRKDLNLWENMNWWRSRVFTRFDDSTIHGPSKRHPKDMEEVTHSHSIHGTGVFTHIYHISPLKATKCRMLWDNFPIVPTKRQPVFLWKEIAVSHPGIWDSTNWCYNQPSQLLRSIPIQAMLNWHLILTQCSPQWHLTSWTWENGAKGRVKMMGARL